MILAALLIGLTVIFTVWSVRPPSKSRAPDAHRLWLVLPDEPRPAILALPQTAPVRPMLPALAVTYPAWTEVGQGWRAEKPVQPWFRAGAPYAEGLALGVMAHALTALGLGVPE